MIVSYICLIIRSAVLSSSSTSFINNPATRDLSLKVYRDPQKGTSFDFGGARFTSAALLDDDDKDNDDDDLNINKIAKLLATFFPDLTNGCQCIQRMMSTYPENDVKISISNVKLSLLII
jgi:hypothetical protein